MMRFNTILLFAACAIAAVLSVAVGADVPATKPGPAPPKEWTPELSMQVRNITEVLPSPDGSAVVWTESVAVMTPEKSEMNTQLFFAHSDGSNRLQLTRGEKSANAAEFSPDGAFVYFASERAGKKNVFRIAVDGGEAEKVTDWKGGFGDYHISPNGKW